MLVHLFDIVNFRNIAQIDHRNGDIDSMYIKLNKRAPHQLNIVINSSFPRFKELLEREDFGIRVQEANQDILFIFRKRTLTDRHQVELTMPSYSYFLATTPLNNLSRVLRNYSLATFLSDLDSSFVFTAIGADRNVDITTGSKDNLLNLTDAVTYPEFFDWVDAGLKDVGGNLKPEIVYGDFRDIESYYNSTSDQRFKPINIRNLTTTDNLNDEDTLFLENVEITSSQEVPQYIFPYVNNGLGFTEANSVQLRSDSYSFINEQFPIQKFTSSVSGKDYYCVINPFASATNKFKVYEYEMPSNTQDVNATFDTTIDISEEVLYRRCVSYIQTLKSQSTVKITPSFKKMIMAGTVAKVRFSQTIKGYDTKTIYTQDYSDDYILDNIEFDLANFAS